MTTDPEHVRTMGKLVVKSLRFTPPDQDEWVAHEKPTEVSNRCADIEAAQVAFTVKVGQTWTDALNGKTVSKEQVVSDAYEFAKVIGRLAPDCADKSAAMRSLRLGRSVVWTAVGMLQRREDGEAVQAVMNWALHRIQEARMQAQDAVVIQFAKQAWDDAGVQAVKDALEAAKALNDTLEGAKKAQPA